MCLGFKERRGGDRRLEGRDGATITEQAVNMAPCHLPGVDGTIDGSLLRDVWQCHGCNGNQGVEEFFIR